MFTQPIKNQDDKILKELARAYKCYNSTEWEYKNTSGIGSFLIDGCITETSKLKYIATIIGHGLIKKNEDAKVAALLFEKLYKDGFKNGLHKDAIRSRFKEILPKDSVEKLNEGGKMAAYMEIICIYEQFLNLNPA